MEAKNKSRSDIIKRKESARMIHLFELFGYASLPDIKVLRFDDDIFFIRFDDIIDGIKNQAEYEDD